MKPYQEDELVSKGDREMTKGFQATHLYINEKAGLALNLMEIERALYTEHDWENDYSASFHIIEGEEIISDREKLQGELAPHEKVIKVNQVNYL